MRLIYLNQPWDGAGERLGDHLNSLLRQGDPRFASLRIAVAFAKSTGVLRIADGLKLFRDNGGDIEVVVGIERKGTSQQALQLLMDLCTRVIIFHNEGAPTFHPKLYVFGNDRQAVAFVGSSNLTAGGLYINYEHNLRLVLDLTRPSDASFHQRILDIYQSLSAAAGGVARSLDAALLQELIDRGKLLDEARAPAGAGEAEEGVEGEEEPVGAPLFGTLPVPPPPPAPGLPRTRVPRSRPGAREVLVVREPPQEEVTTGFTAFVMTLQRTDVSVGQTTPGTSPRSPDIFIPLAALDANQDFWGFPGNYEEHHTRIGRTWERIVQVRVRPRGRVVRSTLRRYEHKSDLRLNSNEIRALANVGDILLLRLAPPGLGFDYEAEVIKQNHPRYEHYRPLCTVPVRPPSRKRFGYL